MLVVLWGVAPGLGLLLPLWDEFPWVDAVHVRSAATVQDKQVRHFRCSLRVPLNAAAFVKHQQIAFGWFWMVWVCGVCVWYVLVLYHIFGQVLACANLALDPYASGEEFPACLTGFTVPRFRFTPFFTGCTHVGV